MHKLNTLLLFLLSSFHHHILLVQPSSATTVSASSSDFIRNECGATRYPTLCIQSLSNYTTTIQLSGRQLAKAALSVSLSRTKSAVSFISNLNKTGGAVADCVQNMVDTVDQLSRSVKELDAMGAPGQDFAWHVSNVETWVSAALTDENTCLDGLDKGGAVDEEIKVAIRKRVRGCARVTSNALALVNRFAGSLEAASTKMP